MRKIKKINIGLVLTIITVLAVIIYSVNIESARKMSKEEIRQSCEEYITVLNKYMVLPESAQILGENAKEVSLDDYEVEVDNELKKIMVNDNSARIQKLVLKDFVQRDLLNTTIFTTNYNKKITKINSYVFDGNQVTVTFEAKDTYKQKYLDINPENGETQEKVKENSNETEGNAITLEKKDGKWKVVYSNFNNGYENFM